MSLHDRPVRVFIVDDSELVRVGLRTLLSTESRVVVVGEAGSVASAVELAGALVPDVVLMDIRLPDGTGFDACRRVRERTPSARVLFLSSVVDGHLVQESVKSGGNGYILKEVNGTALVQAIADTAEGKAIFDPSVAARVLEIARAGDAKDPFDSLSTQEHRVLELVAAGKTNKEAGQELQLSDKTVKNYLSSVFEKLKVSRRAQLAAVYAKSRHD